MSSDGPEAYDTRLTKSNKCRSHATNFICESRRFVYQNFDHTSRVYITEIRSQPLDIREKRKSDTNFSPG